MNLEPMQKAAVLIEALPYIQRFNRKIVVIKYGGSAMIDEELKKKVIQDVALLKLVALSPLSSTAAERRSALGGEGGEWNPISSTACGLRMSLPWRLRKWY